MQPLGLIAGEGVFPHLVASGAKAAGRPVICAGLGRHADESLAEKVDVFQRVGVLRLGAWASLLRRHGCEEAIMVGRVAKNQVHSRWRYFQYVPDLAAIKLLAGTLRTDKRDFAILGAVADTLAEKGITLIDTTTYSTEHLTTEGLLTTRGPSEAQLADIEFGWPLAKMLSTNDVGQALAVRELDVLAVEAVEGTNAMIARAGELCRGSGWTLVKVANATLDPRFDVPCVGTDTIANLAAARCSCLVLEAGRTMMLEKPAVIAAAEKAGIAIVGRT